MIGVGVRDGQPARLIEQDLPWDVFKAREGVGERAGGII